MNVEAIKVSLWVLSAASLVGGFYIGWSIHAKTGATLLVLSAVLALLPFADHRNK